MEISVRQTNLKPNLIKALLTNGIVLISHLNTFSIRRLAQRTRLPISDCEKILAATKPRRPYYILRASDIMVKPFERISTLNERLNQILGGGLRCGKLIEVSGEAGSGKSNFCAEIGTLVMLPEDKGGMDSEVLLIHTEGEGKLKLEIKRFNALADSVGKEEVIEGRLHVINCSNEFELCEMINRLPEILDKHPTVKLIVIDSMTCAFIAIDKDPDFEYYAKRSLILTKIVKTLTQIAWDRRLAIIATNHVSYNPKFGQNRPALGRLWSHMCHTKIYLKRKQTNHGLYRYAYVSKGAILCPEEVEFQITNNLFN